MEFDFNCEQTFGAAGGTVFALKAGEPGKARNKQIQEVIDQMGYASARAQRLPSVITTSDRFFSSTSDQELFMQVEGMTCQGLLKIGSKKLFIRTESGQIKELEPLCVLDFYVHESCQRMGLGKKLFDKMLEMRQCDPKNLAYDKPSEKLIGFLAKHFGLTNYIPQNNNYVVFQEGLAFLEEEYQKKLQALRMPRRAPNTFYGGSNRRKGHSFSGYEPKKKRAPATMYGSDFGVGGMDTSNNVISKSKMNHLLRQEQYSGTAPSEFHQSPPPQPEMQKTRSYPVGSAGLPPVPKKPQQSYYPQQMSQTIQPQQERPSQYEKF